jgi:endonuclease-3
MSALDELVLTILSQNTSDVNSRAAYESLRRAFPTWAAVERARLDEVVSAIAVGGLARQKAPRIQSALREVRAREGRLSLDRLSKMSLEEALAYLRSFQGVGPKTAAIVALFSLGLPAFPVDTHVHRVGLRLGLIAPGTSAEKAHLDLAEAVPPPRRYAFHVNLIRHGREICRARRPECERCPLTDLCRYYKTVSTG